MIENDKTNQFFDGFHRFGWMYDPFLIDFNTFLKNQLDFELVV